MTPTANEFSETDNDSRTHIRLHPDEIARQWLCRDLQGMGISDEGLEALNIDRCFEGFDAIMDEHILTFCEEFAEEYSTDLIRRLGIKRKPAYDQPQDKRNPDGDKE